MIPNYFDDRKSFKLFSMLIITAFRQKKQDSIGVGLDGFF